MNPYPTAPGIPSSSIATIAAELGVDPAVLEAKLAAAEAAAEPPAAEPAAPPAPAVQGSGAAPPATGWPPVTPAPALALPPVPVLEPAPAAVAAAAVTDTPAAQLPAVTHNKPLLTYGAAGDIVEELVRLLAVNGYPNTTFATGQNGSRVLDNSVMSEVKRFAADHGISEQIKGFEGLAVPAAQLVGEHVGPYIWQALYDGAKIALAAL